MIINPMIIKIKIKINKTIFLMLNHSLFCYFYLFFYINHQHSLQFFSTIFINICQIMTISI
jgi:hypothetical protein